MKTEKDIFKALFFVMIISMSLLYIGTYYKLCSIAQIERFVSNLNIIQSFIVSIFSFYLGILNIKNKINYNNILLILVGGALSFLLGIISIIQGNTNQIIVLHIMLLWQAICIMYNMYILHIILKLNRMVLEVNNNPSITEDN